MFSKPNEVVKMSSQKRTRPKKNTAQNNKEPLKEESRNDVTDILMNDTAENIQDDDGSSSVLHNEGTQTRLNEIFRTGENDKIGTALPKQNQMTEENSTIQTSKKNDNTIPEEKKFVHTTG